MSKQLISSKSALTLLALAHASMLGACATDGASNDAAVAPTVEPAAPGEPPASAPAKTPSDALTPAVVGQLQTLQTGFAFTEGPAVDKDGNVFFTDQPNDRIHKWTAATGEITTFLEGTGRSNGMAFDKDGYLITCADMRGEIRKIAPDGTQEVLIDNYQGKRFNGPNDLWISPATGGIYFSDPIYPRDYWAEDDPRRQAWPPTHSEQADTGKGGHVYYLAPGAKEAVRVTTMTEWNSDSWPNGVVGTPDGSKVYVSMWTEDSRAGTFVFDANADGTLANMKPFVQSGGDGMSMDERGNIYISNLFGVEVFDPSGNNVLTIGTDADGKKGATNNVFAGPDGKTLFITGPSDRVVTVQMNLAGIEKF